MSKIFTRAEINKKTAKSIARFYAVQTTLIARKVEVLTLQLKLALLLLYSSINSKKLGAKYLKKGVKTYRHFDNLNFIVVHVACAM